MNILIFEYILRNFPLECFVYVVYSSILTKACKRSLFYLNVDTNIPSLSNGACQNEFAGPDHCLV